MVVPPLYVLEPERLSVFGPSLTRASVPPVARPAGKVSEGSKRAVDQASAEAVVRRRSAADRQRRDGAGSIVANENRGGLIGYGGRNRERSDLRIVAVQIEHGVLGWIPGQRIELDVGCDRQGIGGHPKSTSRCRAESLSIRCDDPEPRCLRASSCPYRCIVHRGK